MKSLVNVSLKRYFDSLSILGYVNNKEVDKLIVLMFIQELLDGECKEYIEEYDYMIIHKVLYCLYGSTCLIPYPEYISNVFMTCMKELE